MATHISKNICKMTTSKKVNKYKVKVKAKDGVVVERQKTIN
jgi:hypothetical protein